MPDLFVITGPNGAGKSSNAISLLPRTIDLPVFDGDKLFYELLDKYYNELKVVKYAREKANQELDTIFQQQIRHAIDLKLNYAYEGHFSNEHSWSAIKQFRDNEYKINMIYLALESVDLSLQRVAVRVSQGGHFVPTINIYDNYFGNLKMLDSNLDLIDNLKIIDNSFYKSSHILTIENQKINHIGNTVLPNWIRANMPNLLELQKHSSTD